jgi:hypothetical protein
VPVFNRGEIQMPKLLKREEVAWLLQIPIESVDELRLPSYEVHGDIRLIRSDVREYLLKQVRA